MIKIVESMTGSGKSTWPAGAPFVVDSQNPRDLHLPHDTWRKHQLETLLWLTDGEPHTVIALVRTKSLQMHQYDAEYGFTAHYGRANYDCVFPGADPGTRCNECKFLNNGGMQACPVSSNCEYLLSKHAAMNSPKASLNYAYWMTARNWRANYPPQMLFCDEAHNLSEIVLQHVGTTVRDRDRMDYGLPNFPILDSTKGSGMLIRRASPVDSAIDWLEHASTIMDSHRRRLEKYGDREAIERAEHLGRRLDNCLSSIRQCSDDWFIKSGPDVREYRGELEPAFICRPLTAKHHAPYYFTGQFDTVMMSATIGKVQEFARELGLDDYEFRAVPSQWPPESRPIHILDVPKMGYVKGESERARKRRFDKQADEIAKFIKRYPGEWSGLIHVTRKTEEVNLAKRLSSRGLGDRVWYMPGKVESYIPTDRQLSRWKRRLAKVSNSILVSASFGEGYDGRQEQINVSAKIPYRIVGRPGSYEYAWMIWSRSRYDQDAALALAQQQGRNRRGRACDYDTPDEARGANAIADGSFDRVFGKLPIGIQEAVVR